MANFLSDGLRALFGDPPPGKKEKPSAKKGASGRTGGSSKRAGGGSKAVVSPQRPMTPEREKLLRQAAAVHKAKQKILADLDDESREKLVALAFRALLNEGRSDRND